MKPSKSLRIAMFFSSNPSSTGGVQEHVMYLSDELRKRGHTVAVFGPEGKSNQYKDYHAVGYTIQVPLPNGNWASVQMSRPFTNVGSIFSEKKFDILHVHEPYIPFLAWQVVEQTQLPKVSTFHSAWDNNSVVNALNNILPMFKDKFSQNMNAAIFVSKITQKRWRGMCHKNVSQHIVYNAVDRDSFSPVARRENGKVKLLFLGRVVARKGIRYLLTAFKTIARDFPHATLEIVGGGAEVENTVNFIRKNGLSRQVSYQGEIFGLKRVPYFQTADIFCAPYFDEASPLTILEAMSCGCTIVGFRNEAVKESLRHYPAGHLLVEQRNTKALATALKRAIRDVELRKNVYGWCLKESKKYSWSQVARDTEKIYFKAIEKYYA